MPARNTVKQFIENGHYHIYNRGVEKRDIFLDEQDYAVFLSYLKKYLNSGSDPDPIANEVNLLAFCLMPNHFHLLAKQHTINGITKLMRAVCTKYVMFFNKKYERVGGLFQGKYKAALILEDDYLLHVSRYIHLNPWPGSDPSLYPYSSYAYYLGRKNAAWIKPHQILEYFKMQEQPLIESYSSYEKFIEDYKLDSEKYIGGLALEGSHTQRVGP